MNQLYKNIMVAVDGSKESSYAFQRGLEIAKRDGAKITVVHVVDTKSYVTFEPYSNLSISDAKNYGETLLQEYRERAAQADYDNIDIVLESGSPKKDLPQTIPAKHDVDLIICGATGLNAVERLLIGSVSEQIVRAAKCDVLIVRNEMQGEITE